MMTDIESLRRRRDALLASLKAEPLRGRWWHRHTELADEVVRSSYAWVAQQAGEELELAIAATGGYGRRELCPYSDVDISVLVISMAQPNLDRTLKALFRDLNRTFTEVLQVQVGYTYRPLSDLAGLDSKSWTSLLDSRFITGSNDVFEEFQERTWSMLPGGAFLIDKLAERDAARARHGSTPLLVEPHLKEGAGGLRSAHAADWIRVALSERRHEALPEYRSLLRMRCLLHAVAGKPLDQMNLARRQEMAEILGVSAGELGSRISAAMCRLEAEEQSARAAIHSSTFAVSPAVEAWNGSFRVLPGATASEAAQACVQAHGLGLKPAGPAAGVRAEAKAGEALDAVMGSAEAIRAMDQAGVLEALLPELTVCRHLMPSDASHRYTVFEHTLQAIGRLDELKPGAFLNDLYESLNNKAALRLAVLLHDAGKADPTERHSITGEKIASAVCERWRTYPETRSLTTFLVREHLTLAQAMRSRDPQDPNTSAELARLVVTEERLAALTLMTYADVGAVAPDSWNPIQEALLIELFSRTAERLAGTAESEGGEEPILRRRAAARLSRSEAPAEGLETFLEAMPAAYLAGVGEEEMRRHLGMVQESLAGGPQIDIRHDRTLGISEITVAAPDQPGHLSRILGALYASDLSLLNLRAATTSGPQPAILDSLTVSAGRRSISDRHSRLVTDRLRGLLSGELELEPLMRSLGKDPTRRQEILRWTLQPGETAIWDVEAPRGRGLAYRCSRMIADAGWQIALARLGQWAGRGSVSFYIRKGDGQPIEEGDIRRLLHSDAG